MTHLTSGLGLAQDYYLGLGAYEFRLAVAAIVFLELVHMMQRRVRITSYLAARGPVLRWTVYYVGIITIVIFGEFGGQEFVYFQF